ncbi:MAG: hypothetical protein U0X73_01565 [Thermoanaerobaculia bacterium]
MSDERDDPFFIGWLPEQPEATARRVRAGVAFAGGVALATLAVVTIAPATLPASRFDWGSATALEGFLLERPVPALWLAGEGAAARTGGGILPLVAPGKFGAADLVRGRDGQAVRLAGALLERDGLRMLEVRPESIVPVPGVGVARPGSLSLGPATLVGEIVDSKCWTGAMNPGEGKVHRDCAVRCISGGMPPALVVRSPAGGAIVLLLVGARDEAIGRELLDRVGEPVEVRGEVVRWADRLAIRAAPADVRRLPDAS